MLAFAPEHGLLLQPRLAQETAELDLWALCDLWNTFRRKKRMLSPADVKSLKDAEEGTKIMAGMDYEHHVATGNAEPLVEDGLLTKEDLRRSETWIRQRIFAHSLLRMAKEEPPFCELCLEMRLTPRPLPLELSTKATLEEVQGQPEPKEEPKAPKAGYNGQSRGETDGARSSSTARGGATNGKASSASGVGGRDFSLGGSKSSAPHRGAPHRPPAGPTGPMGFGGRPGGGRSGGRGPGGRAKGFGKGKGGFGGFGQMGQMGGFGLGPGLDGGMPGMGVMPVEVNGEELLMTEGGLLVDPETQAPVGVLNPMTGEVQEITEEHVQKLMETIGQINMVELNGRPYLMMAGLLVDPQTQEVAFKVEPDGTVVDAQTGETMGMVDLDGQEANVVPTMPPKRHEPSQSFTNENLDAHGWFERAKELVADDYFYQAASAFTEALQCCQEERAVELDFECDLLKGRASCWRKMGEFKSLLEDAEKLISYDADDQEAHEWKRLAQQELSKGRRR